MDAKICERNRTCILSTYFLEIFINYKGRNSNFTLEKHGRHQLNQDIKVNNIGNKVKTETFKMAEE